MTIAAAALATIVLAAISVVQLMAATGRPVGRFVWGGRHEVLPRALRIGSALSVVLYAGMAAALISRVAGQGGVLVVVVWVLVGYFTLGVLMNGVSRSSSERLMMTPACAVLAVCALLVALGV